MAVIESESILHFTYEFGIEFSLLLSDNTTSRSLFFLLEFLEKDFLSLSNKDGEETLVSSTAHLLSTACVLFIPSTHFTDVL
jgi:hypothetical protein